MAEAFHNRENIEKGLVAVALCVGAAMLAQLQRPWHEFIFFGAIAVCAVALFEIRGKLEAIRFMMAHTFYQQLEVEEERRISEDDR